jgi:hypothetical protein
MEGWQAGHRGESIPSAFFREALRLALEAVNARKRPTGKSGASSSRSSRERLRKLRKKTGPS